MLPSCSQLAALGAILAFLSACDSRISVSTTGEGAGESTGGAGGTGGAGAAGTGTSTSATGSGGVGVGAGGSGGTTIACDTLTLDGFPRSPVPEAPGFEQVVPRLVPIEPDGSRAALVYHEGEEVTFTDRPVASVALDTPWGDWPEALGTSAIHGLTTGIVAAGGKGGQFAMLSNDLAGVAGVPTSMLLWTPTAGAPGAESQSFDDLPAGTPRFLAAGTDRWMAGFTAFGQDALGLARLASPIASSDFAGGFSCAKDYPPTGAALPWGDGFLLAQSAGRPFSTCNDDGLTSTVPERLQIVVVDGGLGTAALKAEYAESGTYVFQVAAAASATGAWLAWELLPPLAELDPPAERDLRLLQLDAAGFPKTGKVYSVHPGIPGAPFGLATLGDRPVLATTQAGEGQGVVDVTVYSEQVEPMAQIALPPEDGFTMLLDVALMASPAGDRLLVAWGETDGGEDRVRVARLACAGSF